MELIRVNGARSTVPYSSALKVLQTYVGGYIEFFGFADGTSLIVNEEGKLEGLPINHAATALTASKGRPEIIAGDALFLSAAEMKTANDD